MRFLTIEKTRIGYRIKDSLTDDAVHYIGYTARAAEKAYRAAHDLRYKHFTKIYI